MARSNQDSIDAGKGFAPASWNSSVLVNAYYPLDAPFFTGKLKLDFAWSLADLIKDEPQ